MEQTSTSKVLDSMDEGTKYLTPIFGSEASDAQMPRLRMNDKPVEPRIAYEMIKEYPVSYTHLDVYKRQPIRQGASMEHLTRQRLARLTNAAANFLGDYHGTKHQ